MSDKPANSENIHNGENAKTNVPQFNWVTERSSCSLPRIFKDLRSQVEADIKTRNGMRPNNSPYEFSVADKGSDFVATLEIKSDGKDVHKSVQFSLLETVISVRDGEGKSMFDVTLTFNDRGECKLYVNEEERELWQVRRMALEDLLFKGY